MQLVSHAELLRKNRSNYDPRANGALCDECPLKEQKNAVPCKSAGRKTLAIIGEAPGRREEDEQQYFVGESGKKLDDGLTFFQIPKSRLHINNVIQCRPLRELSPNEWRAAIKCCRPRLQRELVAAGTAWIYAVGKKAFHGTTTHNDQLQYWIGAKLEADPDLGAYSVIASYHPAFCMRGKQAYFSVFYEHLNRAWQFATNELKDWKWPTVEIEIGPSMVRALERLAAQPKVGFDVETAGDAWQELLAVGFGSYKARLAVSIPWPPEKYSDDKKVCSRVRALAHQILTDPKIAKCMHNAAHDTISARLQLKEIRGEVRDTIVKRHIIAPELLLNLGFSCAIEFHCDAWKTEFGVKSDYKGLEKFTRAAIEDLCEYNGKDAFMGDALDDASDARLPDIYNGAALVERHMQCVFVEHKMRWHGARANLSKLAHHERIFKGRRRHAKKQLRTLARIARFPKYREFNPNSKDDLHALFFEKLRVAPTRYSDKTGKPSLDNNTLRLLVTHPKPIVCKSARVLMRYRRWQKLLRTYVQKLKYDTSGIIHAEGKPWGTKTGRWSYGDKSNRFSPQTIPKPKYRQALKVEKDGTRKKILVAPGLRDIIAPREGNWLVEADYSQLELRIIALLAGDDVLLKAYARGEDTHQLNAKMLFNTQAPTKGQRDLAKRFVYAVNYGGDARTIWLSLVVDFEGLYLSDIMRYQEIWFRLHPKIRAWQRRAVAKARDLDYIEMPVSGRRIQCHKIVEPAKVYNMPVQGTGADIIDAAIVRIDRQIKWGPKGNGGGGGEFLLFQVHDSIVGEGPNPTRLATIFKKEMEAEITLAGNKQTFPIDLKISKRDWGAVVECKDIEHVRHFSSCRACEAAGEFTHKNVKGTKQWRN